MSESETGSSIIRRSVSNRRSGAFRIHSDSSSSSSSQFESRSCSASPPVVRGPPRRPRGKYDAISIEKKKVMINLHAEGFSIKEASEKAGLKWSTGKSIIRKYVSGDSEVKPDARRGGNRPKKVTPDVLQLIEAAVEEEPGITLRGIQDKLSSQHNIVVSITAVANGLKTLKITLKKASIEIDRMNCENSIERRKQYAIDFRLSVPQQHEFLVFIDETGFNLHLRRTRARSRRGTRAIVTVPTVRGRNVSLILAMNNMGVVHSTIIASGTTTASHFRNFLQEVEQRLGTSAENTVLIMDNAKIHKAREVNVFMDSSPMIIKFLPPYSPMLNPAEHAFSQIKNAARRIMSVRGEHNLVEVIARSVGEVTPNDCSNYVMNMFINLTSAASGQRLS